MTKHEQIKGHLQMIRKVTTPGVIWDCRKIVSTVQEELDAIKGLLEPEPETLATSVLCLTDICNELERENATLRNGLTTTQALLDYAQRELDEKSELNARLKQDLTLAKTHLEEIKYSLESRSVEQLKRELEQLKREWALQERYIELLKQDRRSS